MGPKWSELNFHIDLLSSILLLSKKHFLLNLQTGRLFYQPFPNNFSTWKSQIADWVHYARWIARSYAWQIVILIFILFTVSAEPVPRVYLSLTYSTNLPVPGDKLVEKQFGKYFFKQITLQANAIITDMICPN